MRLLVALVLALALAPLSSVAMGREWTTRGGRSLGEGKLLDVGDDWVSIQFAARGTQRVPISQLSLDDVVFAREAAAIAFGAAPAGTAAAPSAPPTSPPAELAPPGKNPNAATEPTAVAGDDPFPMTRPDSTAWQVHTDPPSFQWTEADIERAKAAKLPIANTSSRIDLPAQPSPFVAITSGRNSPTWDLWDLRSAERLGTVRGAKVVSGRVALSADGKYLASASREHPRGAAIWSLESGKKLREIATEESSDHELMLLAGGRLLLTNRRGDSASIYDPHSLAVSKLATQWGSSGYEVKWASSPGGHYVAGASLDSDRIEFFDARNGAMAGDVLIPPAESGAVRIEQIAFSTDGKEIFAWGQNSDSRTGGHIYRWSLETGKLEADLRFSTGGTGIERSQVSGLAPGTFGAVARGWLLYGSSLIDAESGAKVWSNALPSDTMPTPVLRVLDESHVLTAGRDSSRVELRVEQLPLDQIAKSREIVAAGGTWQDLSLPKLTKVESDNASRGEGFPVATTAYAPGPRVAWPEELADLSQLSLMMAKKATGFVSHVCFPRAAPRLAVALARLSEAETQALPADAPERRLPHRLDVIDMVRETRTFHWNLAAAVSLLGLSPSGERALVLSTSDGRIDVYDIQAGKHIVGFRPPAPAEMSAPPFWGTMVDEDHAMLFDPTGVLSLWKLQPCERVYARTTLAQSAPAASHDGKYVAVATADGVVVAESLTGAAVVTLPLGELDQTTRIAALEFSPDGKMLVAVVIHPLNPARMMVWNIADKSLDADMQLPRLAIGRVSWAGDDVLLSGLPPQALAEQDEILPDGFTPSSPQEAYMQQQRQYAMMRQGGEQAGAARFNLARGDVTWSYLLPGCRLLSGGPGGRSWFLYRTPNYDTKLFCLGSLTDDERAVLDAVPEAAQTEIRGADVALTVDVGPLPEFVSRGEQRRADFTKVLQEHFRKALAERSFKYKGNGPITLKVVLRDQRGEDLPRSPYNPRQTHGLGALARLSMQAGEQMLWSTEQWLTANMYNAPQDMGAGAGAAYMVAWDKAVDWLLASKPPRELSAASTLQGLGQSRLTPGGVVISRKRLPGGEAPQTTGESPAPDVQ